MKLIERGNNYKRFRLDSPITRDGKRVYGVKFHRAEKQKWTPTYVTVDYISEWYDSKRPGEWVGD